MAADPQIQVLHSHKLLTSWLQQEQNDGSGQESGMSLFLSLAEPAVALALLVLRDKSEAAKVSVKVASQMSVQPVFQGQW